MLIVHRLYALLYLITTLNSVRLLLVLQCSEHPALLLLGEGEVAGHGAVGELDGAFHSSLSLSRLVGVINDGDGAFGKFNGKVGPLDGHSDAVHARAILL